MITKNIKNIIRQYANLAIIIMLAALIVLMSSTCCFPIEKKAKETRANKESDKIAETVNRDLVGSNTGFALKILKELSNESETSNVFISPISISLSAAIAYNGAKNNTANEIAETFEFKDYNIDEFNISFKNLLLSMRDIDEMVKLHTANSIWFEKDFVIKESFTDTVENSYSASIFNKDFKKAETVNEINSWVSNTTEQKITKVIDKQALSDSVMILISAIYFKGQWKEKFKEENTKEDDFFLMDESIKKVQMMQITR
ncbi:MAG: serpin family protein, partial [Actinobacteria bacterium]|nr:serpin family protein [Actinomycetota bacterium]